MVPYAIDNDLDEYDTDVRSQGVESFRSDLVKASNEILNLVKTVWWPETGRSINSFEEAKLNEAALKQVTIYKAFYKYIFPRLANFTEGDVFLQKIDFYKELFKEEWLLVTGLPLYDFDDSDTFDDDEVRGPNPRRLARG